MQTERGAARLWVDGEVRKQPRPQPSCIQLAPEQLDANLIVGFEHLDERAHPFLAIRAKLLEHAENTRSQLFAVTSVQPGNGKSHIAVNLAATLSRIVPTVLVELDLRRPSLGARLGLPLNQPGVDDFLAGKCLWKQTGLRIDAFDLTVHRVRKARANAEFLLSASSLEELFDGLRSHVDRPICIIDCPPAIVDDDITLIKRSIDGILMVVEEARTPKRALRDTLIALSPTPIVGAILNKSISSTSPSVGYDYYRDQALIEDDAD